MSLHNRPDNAPAKGWVSILSRRSDKIVASFWAAAIAVEIIGTVGSAFAHPAAFPKGVYFTGMSLIVRHGLEGILIIGTWYGKKWAFLLTAAFTLLSPIFLTVNILATRSPYALASIIGSMAYLPLGIYCLLRALKWDRSRPDGLPG